MLKSETYTKGALLALIFNAGSKIVQFGNIFIVSALFGASKDTDLYYFLLNFVTIVLAGFISGIDTSILIPEFIRLRDRETPKEAMGFINKYFYLYIFLGVLFSVFVFIGPMSFYTLFSKFEIGILTTYKTGLYLTTPLFIMVILCNLLSNVLVSYKFFTMPNIVAFVNSLLSLLFLLIFYKKFGIISAIYGLVLGYIINFFFLIYIFKKKANWNFSYISKRFERKIMKSITGNQLIVLIVSIRLSLTQFLLSGFAGGTLTSINWGNQIASISDNFINSQFYSIAGIKFSEHYIKDEKNKSVILIYSLLSLLVTVNLIGISVYFNCAREISSLLNYKSNMNSYSLNVLVNSIMFLSLIPLINLITFLTNKLLASYQLINSKFVQFSFIGQIVMVIITWIFVNTWGYLGYFFASILGFGIIAILNIFLLFKNFETIYLKNILISYIFAVCLAIAIIGFGTSLFHKLYFTYFNNPVIYILLVTTITCLLFLKKLKKDVANFKKNIK